MTNLWLRVAAHKLLRDRAEAAYDAVRAKAAKSMDRADRKSVYTPDKKTYLGAVSLSNPERTAGIGDAAAFLDWVKATYPDEVEFDMEIVGPADEVKAVLYQHAKHLVKLVEKVTPAFRAKVLEASNNAGEPAGPSDELDVPGIVMSEAATSRVSFRPAKDAGHAITELIRNGTVQLPDLFAEPSDDTADGGE